MKFSVKRDELLKPLALVAGVVERRQTLPILANVLVSVDKNQLLLVGTDLEVQIGWKIQLDGAAVEPGEITVPARKFLDICKSLPDGAAIEFAVADGKVTVKSGRSRFTLSSLPASEFPSVEEGPGNLEIALLQGQLKRLIDNTAFAMAQQDVRFYLNGMLWEISSNRLRVVATDGHRLAFSEHKGEFAVTSRQQVIVPRKGVIELARLLANENDSVKIVLGSHHVRASTPEFTFISKLVDGKFPDYERVLPKGGSKLVYGSRTLLKEAFARTSILSNEKYRGIRLILSENNLQLLANNPEQEEAEESVMVDYHGDGLEIGFNVSYLVDVLSVLSCETVKITLADANSSALIESAENGDSMYVVMPMRL